MEQAAKDSKPLHRVKPGPKPKAVLLATDSPAQSLALRIWEGQSPDVAVIDRVARIANALKDKGHPLTGIELPHPDAGRYLEAH